MTYVNNNSNQQGVYEIPDSSTEIKLLWIIGSFATVGLLYVLTSM